MDILRARMVREGYQLAGLTQRERERVWYSLAGKTRRPHLAKLIGIEEALIDGLVAGVRRQRVQLTGRH
jgi:hypothetical protein